MIDLVFNLDNSASTNYAHIQKSGERLTTEVFIPHLNKGKGVLLLSTAAPFYDQNHILIGAVETVRDITKERQEINKLSLRDRVINNLAEGINVTSASDGRIIYTNPRFDRLFGYKVGELLGRKISVLNAEGDESPEQVAEKIKKVIRDKGGVIDGETRLAIKKELGDVLWYVSQIATELQLELDEIAEKNIEKLYSRMDRDKLSGSGDDR